MTVVRVDFQEIDPPGMKKMIDDKCDTVPKASTRSCLVQATFVYTGNTAEEKTNGSRLMTIFAEDGKATFGPAK